MKTLLKISILALLVSSYSVFADHDERSVEERVRELTPVIGSLEKISVPAADGKKFSIPAKIDTGAASSCMHATKIEKFKKDGKEFARFVTVNDDEPVVMEAPITREDEVTSSNGHSEDRVFVSLPVKIGDHKFWAEFSLADRSAMKLPVLLGASLLRNRFLVDVSRESLLSN